MAWKPQPRTWAPERGAWRPFFPPVTAASLPAPQLFQTRGYFGACMTWVPACVCAVLSAHTGVLFLHALSSGGRGPFPEPRWARSTTRGRWVGPCRAARPRDKAEFPWRKRQERAAAALGSDLFPWVAHFSRGSGHRAEPSWKICCNHYLCSFLIMHLNETQMHPTHCKYGPFKRKCYWRCFNSATP